MQPLHIFGIRHHGVGSAKNLRKALHHLKPDCILIEVPQDAEGLIEYVVNPDLKPPVAMLIYNAKNIQQASYIPFTHFSPEWIAMQFGLQNDTPIRFMDLPMNLQFGISDDDELVKKLNNQSLTPNQIVHDPLAHMSKLAGYADSERWWESIFEKQESEIKIFDDLLDMITALRTGINRMESAETLRREAFMRKMIRKTIREGFERIAVVCGAWHSPVLVNLKKYPIKNDNALLRGIKKVKTTATWIPWTYERISMQSGYGAGIVSPAWYELLFRYQHEVNTRWMVRAVRLMRQSDWEASAAHALEAVRLAETLATLRGLQLPGIEELKEALITIINGGDTTQLNQIERKLIIGDKVGKVPDIIPSVPLQKDFEQQVKSARLKKYLTTSESVWLKATTNNPRGGIDLREENDRLKSQLLHRLNVLNIPWGAVQKAGKFDKGGFKEYWKLHWKPDYYIRIIEASVFGSTVEVAATQSLLKQAATAINLEALTQLIEQALNANLSLAIQQLLPQLKETAALTKEVFQLMDALPATVRILRYGNVRQTDLSIFEELLANLIPRICLGLPRATVSINEEVAEEVLAKIRAVNQAIHDVQKEDYEQEWYKALHEIIQLSTVHPQTEGASIRLLFDRRQWLSEQVAQRMNFVFSPGNEAVASVQWLEGFLHGSGLLIIHHQALWQILDKWIDLLSRDEFTEVLPLLRRAFSNFSGAERKKMLQLVREPNADVKQSQLTPMQEHPAVRTTVGTLLGWTPKNYTNLKHIGT